MIHGYRVTVKFNDGCEDVTYKYKSEKVANSVAWRFSKADCVAKVEIEEF